MDRKTKWRSFWLAVRVAVAVLSLVPSVAGRDALPGWFAKVFKNKVQFGLDIDGGLHIVYSIDLDQAVEDKAAEIKRDLEAFLEEKSTAGRVTTPARPRGAVSVILDSAEDVERIRSRVSRDYDEIVAFRECPANYDATLSVCFAVKSEYAEMIKQSALDQAIRTVRERINERGVSEPSVLAKSDHIIVELPGLDKRAIAEVKDLIERTAKLEFKMVDDDTDACLANKDSEACQARYMVKIVQHVKGDPRAAELGITGSIDSWRHDESGNEYHSYYLYAKDVHKQVTRKEAAEMDCLIVGDDEEEELVNCTVLGRQIIADYLDELAADNPELKIDDDHAVGYEKRERIEADEEPDWRTYFLHRSVELTGTAVEKAFPQWDPTTNRPEVIVDFDRWGGRRFGEMTGNNVGKRMAIILDDKVASTPIIQTKIAGGSTRITLGISDPQEAQKEAEALTDVLRTGSLPAPLRVESESEIGPLLGHDAVSKAQFAFMLGSALVILIMVFYYRTSGVISIIALVLNILFMLSALAIFKATLTLPGIAAIVLTVGMAVDANIIIYERIREELRAGKSVKGAVDAGFSRGFAAIIDGQLTTGVAGYVLYQYGSGPIKGFAVMLMIGIICTLFTATWCTRLFFEFYVGKGRKAARIAI